MSLNPFIADIGILLPELVSGAVIVSVVMSLPTTGPMLLQALRSQDMYLAGSFLMFLALLTVIGMLRVRRAAGRCSIPASGSARERRNDRLADDPPHLRPRRPAVAEPMPHQSRPTRFDPHSVERLSPEQERYLPRLAMEDDVVELPAPPAGGGRRHLPAAVIYASILVSEFLAPYNLHSRHVDFIYAPPQASICSTKGRFIGPFVYGYDYQLNLDTLKRVYTDRSQQARSRCASSAMATSTISGACSRAMLHLVCPAEGGTSVPARHRPARPRHALAHPLWRPHLADHRPARRHRQLPARHRHRRACRLLRRLVDNLSQRADRGAALACRICRCGWRWPRSCRSTWSPLLIYFGITIILGLLDWTGLARAVRSKLLSLREEDFCVAAQLMGARPSRIIGRHLLPSFMSHLIASATLAMPSMILGETALSFLGLGLRPPITSWGVLLNEAQNINVVALYPWLMLPVVPVILVVLAFNFLGDGLRDAADPYK